MKFCQVDDENVARTEDQLSRFYGTGRGKLCADTRGFSSAKGFDAKCNHLRYCIMENNPTGIEFCQIVPMQGLSSMQRLINLLNLLEIISEGHVNRGLDVWENTDPKIKKFIKDKVASEEDIAIIKRLWHVMHNYVHAIVTVTTCPRDRQKIRREWFGIMDNTTNLLLQLYTRILPTLSQAYIMQNVPGLADYTKEIKRISNAEKVLNGEDASDKSTVVDKIVGGIASTFAKMG